MWQLCHLSGAIELRDEVRQLSGKTGGAASGGLGLGRKRGLILRG